MARPFKRIAVPLLKVVVAGACAAGLLWLWKSGQHPDAETPAEDAGNTDVEVRVESVARRSLRQYVLVYGTVSPAPPTSESRAGSARIMSAMSGALEEVLCFEGQRVEKGSPLFKLDSRIADAAVAKQRDLLAYAEQTLARQQKLVPSGGTPAKLVLEAEQQVRLARIELTAAIAQQALLQVVSPLAGTVVHIQAKQGEVVDVTTTLAEVVDLDRLVVTASVPSGDLAKLKVGQEAEFIPDEPGRRSETGGAAATAPSSAPAATQARVTFINPAVDPKTDLGTILISLPPAAHWAPGQLVRLRVVVDEHANRLVVPVESIVDSEDGRKVVCVVEGDRAVQRPVETGFKENDFVEVEGAGIEEGTTVVTKGAYGLPKETKVHIATPATREGGPATQP